MLVGLKLQHRAAGKKLFKMLRRIDDVYRDSPALGLARLRPGEPAWATPKIPAACRSGRGESYADPQFPRSPQCVVIDTDDCAGDVMAAGADQFRAMNQARIHADRMADTYACRYGNRYQYSAGRDILRSRWYVALRWTVVKVQAGDQRVSLELPSFGIAGWCVHVPLLYRPAPLPVYIIEQ